MKETPTITKPNRRVKYNQSYHTNLKGKSSRIKNLLLWEFNYKTNEFTLSEKLLSEFGYTKENITPIAFWKNILAKNSYNQFLDFVKHPSISTKSQSYLGKSFQGKLKIFNIKIRLLAKPTKNQPSILIAELELLDDKIIERNKNLIEVKKQNEESKKLRVILNRSGIIKEVNNSFCILSGYSKKEIINSSIYRLIANESIKELKEELQTIDQQLEKMTLKIVRKNSSFRTVIWKVSKYGDSYLLNS